MQKVLPLLSLFISHNVNVLSLDLIERNLIMSYPLISLLQSRSVISFYISHYKSYNAVSLLYIDLILQIS